MKKFLVGSLCGLALMAGLTGSAFASTAADTTTNVSTESAYVPGEFMRIKVGEPWYMLPQGSGYEYELYSSDEIYVNSKGKVTAYGPGSAEGRVYDKNGNLVARWYITATY